MDPMGGDDLKRSREVRCGALVMATAATFLSLTGCDSNPYQFWKAGERQEQKDQEQADRTWHGGYTSGAHIFGTTTRSGAPADPQTGTVRGGFGKTGAMHASST